MAPEEKKVEKFSSAIVCATDGGSLEKGDDEAADDCHLNRSAYKETDTVDIVTSNNAEDEEQRKRSAQEAGKAEEGVDKSCDIRPTCLTASLKSRDFKMEATSEAKTVDKQQAAD